MQGRGGDSLRCGQTDIKVFLLSRHPIRNDWETLLFRIARRHARGYLAILR